MKTPVLPFMIWAFEHLLKIGELPSHWESVHMPIAATAELEKGVEEFRNT